MVMLKLVYGISNQLFKRKRLRAVLKFSTCSLFLIWSGNWFHKATALFKKLRCPVADVHKGISNSLLFLVLRSCTRILVINLSHKYGGASPLIYLKVRTASRSFNISHTGSHFNCTNTGVIWSYFLVSVTMRAAKFCTFCNL